MLPPPSIRGYRLSRGCVQGTAAYTTSMVQLTAVATPVIAVLNGPQGDVLSTNPIAFSSASIDPDAAATPSSALVRSNFMLACWVQLSEHTAPDMSGNQSGLDGNS